MQIQVKEVEYCKIEVSCLADSDEVLEKKGEILKIFKDAPVPGFRKGKATAQIIENYYKNQINDALKKALMEEAFHQAMFQKEFKPIGAPSFSESFLQPLNFSCQFQVHKRPDFELQNFRSWEIPEPHINSSESDIKNKLVQDMRTLYGERTLFTDDNFLEIGDVASVSYEAYLDGTKMDNLQSEGDVITVGESNIPNFDKNILGMHVGDSREFEITVPDNASPDFVGKTIRFNAKVNMAMKITPAEFNNDLAQKNGKESAQELDEDLSKKAFATYQKRVQALKNNALITKLVTSHDFKIPNWLAIAEAKILIRQSKMEWDSADEKTRSQVANQAAQNIKLSLILEKVRDSEPDAQLSDSELLQYARNYLSSNSQGASVDDLIKNMNNAGYLQVLINKLKDENTINFLVKTVKYI
jgi:trigger factor